MLLAVLVVTVVLFALVALVAIALFGPRCSRGPKSHDAAPHRESQGPPTDRSSAPERGGLSQTNGVPMFTTVFGEIVKTCGSVFRYPTEELLAGAVSAGHSDRNCSPVIAFVCSYFLRMSAWVSPSTHGRSSTTRAAQ